MSEKIYHNRRRFLGTTAMTIAVEGDANGAPHPDASSYARRFSGKYAHRVGELSRKAAKTQSATAFLRIFFAPLRLCARKYFGQRSPEAI